MRMKLLLPGVLLVFIAQGLVSAEELARTYKLKLSGNWWRGKPWTGIIVEKQGVTLRIRFTEQGSTFGALDGRWFDSPAVAVKACLGKVDSFETTDCVTTQGDTITLPIGADLSKYTFDFKYKNRDGSATLQKSFAFAELTAE